MLPEIENLLHLQEADKAIRRLQDEIAELPKRVAAIWNTNWRTPNCNWKKLRPPSRRMKAARRKYDTAIAGPPGKRFPSNRDQSLDVKTNEQYKALLHEIQFAEKEIAATEDKILELMVNADARDKQVKAATSGTDSRSGRDRKRKKRKPANVRPRMKSSSRMARQARPDARRRERRPAAAL